MDAVDGLGKREGIDNVQPMDAIWRDYFGRARGVSQRNSCSAKPSPTKCITTTNSPDQNESGQTNRGLTVIATTAAKQMILAAVGLMRLVGLCVKNECRKAKG